MKKISIILFLILLSSFVTAVDIDITKTLINTNNSNPQILVSYDEPVEIIDNSLFRLDRSFGITFQSSNNKDFIFTPTSFLPNGLYMLNITAVDNVFNSITVTQPFIVDSPYMNIWIENPGFGVSNESVFNLTVRSERVSYCKYGFSPNEEPSFYLPYTFDLQDGQNHILFNVNSPQSFSLTRNSPDAGGKEKSLYVECNDSFGIIHPSNLYIAYDETPPILGVLLTPNPITDPELPFAELIVNASDRSICKYNGVLFPGENKSIFSSYKKDHVVTLDFTDLTSLTGADLFSEKNYLFDIECMNLAALTSYSNDLLLTVNFEEEFDITMTSPEEYTNLNSIPFNIVTSVTTPGGCLFGINSPNNNFDISQGNIYYSENLGFLEEGAHTYQVNCLSSFGDRTEDFTFYIDRVRPENLTIDIQNPTCSLTSVRGELSAQDDGEIDFFNYTITKDNLVLAEDITEGDLLELLSLENQAHYRLNVKAYDQAGNVVEGTKEFQAINSSAPICDFNSPATTINTLLTSDGMIIDIVCIDQESGCMDRFNFGISTTNDCEANTGMNLGESITVTETSTVCWTVYDKNFNNKSDSKLIQVVNLEDAYPAHCFNNETDPFESDVDCGGECALCTEIGSSCVDNSDCATNSCDIFIGECVEPSCDNEYVDGLESDYDCGGLCDPCADRMNCNFNQDCSSNYCFENLCTSESDTNNNETNSDSDVNNNQNNDDSENQIIAIPNDKQSFIGWVFIIIGLILIISGVIFLFLKKDGFEEIRLINKKEKAPLETTDEEIQVERTLESRNFEKNISKRKERRSKLIEAFEKNSDDKQINIKEKKDINTTKSKTSSQTKLTDEEPVKKERSGYVMLDEIEKEHFKEEDIGQDVFEKLELIAKQVEKSEKKKELDIKNKKVSNDEKKQKTLNSESNNLIQKTSSTKEIINYSQDDIFKKLAEMSGKNTSTVKKSVDKEEVFSKDMMNVFANVTSKKQIDTNVFKAILSQLLKKGTISKQTVAEILFEFMDNELLSKKEVASLFRELNIHEK